MMQIAPEGTKDKFMKPPNFAYIHSINQSFAFQSRFTLLVSTTRCEPRSNSLNCVPIEQTPFYISELRTCENWLSVQFCNQTMAANGCRYVKFYVKAYKNLKSIQAKRDKALEMVLL